MSEITDPTAIAPKIITCELEYDTCVNYATQQNAVPVIKRLTITNSTQLALQNLFVSIFSDPPFCEPWKTQIDSLGSSQEYRLTDIDLILSPSFLADLRERTTGHITLQISCDKQLLLNEKHPIELFAYDEWPGTRSLPEMLAAFVMPNHPAIEPILRESAIILGSWTQDTSLSGYQTGNPKRAWLIVAAIYAAIQKLAIAYINPPASFEKTGQKIRTPDRIIENKLGTCLDLTLLCASCIEAAGLNPVLVLLDGHAFPGAWLKNETFSPATIDELQTLRKRSELNELVFFESTSLTSVQARDFNHAIADIAPRLENDDEFNIGIDVGSARKARIRPLPLRANGIVTSNQSSNEPNNAIDGMPIIPFGIPTNYTIDKSTPPAGQTRLDEWKRKLLDLTLRNRLLNFRNTNKTVPLLCPDLPALEDALSAGESFTFSSKTLMAENDPRSAAVHQSRTGEDAKKAFLKEELASNRLHSSLTEQELNKRLLETYRSARTAQEEGGANVCYLALGFLEWKQTEQNDRAFDAPILLLPVELTRKSIQQGFKLQDHDDEPRINVTLLQMLEKDFNLKINGLDPLPRDHSGIDVPAVFQIFRTAVRDIKGWEVKETLHLGLFSFTKYLMWKDLEDRSETLMQNSVVDHLIRNPHTPFPTDGALPQAERIDEILPPSRMFCPRDADSSQLAAIVAASEGHSFVMEGPPGTGKSQTITNMIAQCLAEGKTVLFVAEKLAALSVVHDRLSNVGLAPYCLELHSNKARKADVLRQLGQAALQIPGKPDEEWQVLANELGSLRTDLNEYCKILHKKYANELSAFSATATLVALKDLAHVSLRWPSVDIHTREDFAQLKLSVDNLATTAEACGAITGHPWVGFEHSEWSPGWVQELASIIDILDKNTAILQSKLDNVAIYTGFAAEGNSFAKLNTFDALAAALLQSPGAPKTLLDAPDWTSCRQKIAEVISIGRQRDTLRAKLFSDYTPDILKADAMELKKVFNSATHTWWPISMLRRRKVKQALRLYYKSNKAPANSSISDVLDSVIELQRLQLQISDSSISCTTILEWLWRNGEADWDAIERTSDWVHNFRQVIFAAQQDSVTTAQAIRSKIIDLIAHANDQLQPEGPVGKALLSFRRAYADFSKAFEDLNAKGRVDNRIVWGEENVSDALNRIREKTRNLKSALGNLRYWCAWRLVRQNALSLGLAPLVEAVETGLIETEKLTLVFKKSYCQWWINLLTDQEPLLRQFLRDTHEKKIKRFSQIDLSFMQKTRDVVSSRLQTNRPHISAAGAIANSELGVLNRELQKKKRHIPVRTLLGNIPNLLPRLKPCLLMSPLSVAQYLEPGQQPFDLVIFDEASQIPVWDAVGAIARGKQVVIAGDPKQLPPTNFFMKAQDDEEFSDDNDQIEDLESILDECMGAGLPLMRLNWHYRSRQESLIAFSNYQYYENSLCTFPSPITPDNAVMLRHIANGIYDKGKSRTNIQEARAVVSEVIDRLMDPVRRNHSIGIVTFSQAQQTLIEDMLENERILHPDLDEFFSADTSEHVFVKNLENVQGDERDVILFSICYGRDAMGKLSLNFGPMNRDGGERRLNVAITRARHSVQVFSSITADEIDLRRTHARGVADLKLFLEYSQRGPAALASANSLNPNADFDSTFEKEVHDTLANRGWRLDLQVGCSGYRIDLGVVDNRFPGRYLAGIECDGASYHSAKSARDRDRLRQAVLEDLGWNLIRIWSTDWWLDPKREIVRVESILKAFQDKTPKQEIDTDNNTVQNKDKRIEAVTEPIIAESNSSTVIAPKCYPVYSIFKETLNSINQDNFYESNFDNSISETVLKIIEKEGPISESLIISRIASLWNFARAGNRIQARIRKLIPQNRIKTTKHNGCVWYWPGECCIKEFDTFRIPDSQSPDSRDVIDTAPEEVGNAAFEVLKNHISVDTDELAKQTARILGYSRLAEKTKAHINYSIDFLVSRGLAAKKGQMTVLAS